MARLLPLVLLAMLTAGCSHQQGMSAARAPSGVVRFDLASDPTNLNPLFLHQDSASVEQQVARLSFEPFIDLDPRGKPIPELIARIPTVANGDISRDGRTIVYHLRAGVRWSDGVPVSTSDVLWTLRAILDPRNPVPSHEGYDLIDRAYARDSHTIVFHLRHAWAPAATTFFSYGFRPQFVLPQHILASQAPLAQAAFNADPSVGDGPFTFVRWERGELLSYRANPLYWRGRAASTALEIRVIPDPQTNLVMLRAGQIDWNLIAPAQQRELPPTGVKIRSVPTAVVAGLVFNLMHAPLNDVRVRRAIAMSIDRAGISRKITLGRYPVTDVIQPPFSWAYDSSVKEPPFAPAAADSLLDAAGFKRSGPAGPRERNGKPLSLVYVQFPESVTGVRVATAVQAELRARGIAVEVKSVSNAQLFLPSARGGTLASGQFDMAYVPFTMGSDPDDSSVLACGAPANYMRYCNANVDALERKALSTTSPGMRKPLYARIQRIVASDVPILFLFNARYLYAYRSGLRGFSPNAFLPTWNAAQWSFSSR